MICAEVKESIHFWMIVFVLFFTALLVTSACYFFPQSTIMWCSKITKSNAWLATSYVHIDNALSAGALNWTTCFCSKIVILIFGCFSEQISMFTFQYMMTVFFVADRSRYWLAARRGLWLAYWNALGLRLIGDEVYTFFCFRALLPLCRWFLYTTESLVNMKTKIELCRLFRKPIEILNTDL